MTDNFNLIHSQTPLRLKPQKNQKKSGCLGFLSIPETILLAVILFLAINALSARVRVENVSMKPTPAARRISLGESCGL